MIDRILEELTEATSLAKNANDSLLLDREAIEHSIAPKLYELGNTIISSISPIIGDSLYKHSITECLLAKDDRISIAEYRLRPNNNYYINLNKHIPSPENKKGTHATGLELSLSLFRPFESRKAVIPAKIQIEFQVWGILERQAFGEMLSDYKRLIAKLIQNEEYEFFTSVPFDNVEVYKGKSSARKLGLYFQNEKDDENQFSFSKEFTENNKISEIVGSIIPMTILYECTMGYSQARKNRDRIINFINIISNNVKI